MKKVGGWGLGVGGWGLGVGEYPVQHFVDVPTRQQEAKLAGEEQGKVYLYVYLSQPKVYACVIKAIAEDNFIVCVGFSVTTDFW